MIRSLMKEIERKFLINYYEIKYLIANAKKIDIKQGYLKKGTDLRVRIANNEAYLTYKIGSGIERTEFEDKININTAQELIKNSIKIIEKTRYIFDYHGKTWEIDSFKDKDLWLAEIELSNADENFMFIPGIVKEVTDDERYKNKNL